MPGRNLIVSFGAAMAALMLPALALGQAAAWQDAKAIAAEQSKPILIDFYTDW